MNSTTNRTEDRKDILFSLLEISEDKDKELIPNNKTEITNPITDNFISGIIDGDGSFFISFQANGSIKTGFNITNDKASKPLLEGIKIRFKNIGTINEGSKNELVYSVTGINQINNNLIPFIDENPIFSEKALHYEKFKHVSSILKNEQPLSYEKKLSIIEIAYNMNKKGKRRLMSKLEYIKLLKKLMLTNTCSASSKENE